MKWRWIRETKDRIGKERHLEELKSSGGISFALAFPNSYYVGMSNLGFQAIYSLIRKTPGATCERAFLPDEDYLEYFRSGSNLRTLETQRPLHNFDILGFSISYELDFPNVVRMIRMSGIPLRADHRTEKDPLVIAGGAITYLNPEPLADFIDLFFLGEGEETLETFLTVMSARGFSGRAATLRELAKIDGIYVPSLFSPVYDAAGLLTDLHHDKIFMPRQVCRRKVRTFFHSSILTPLTEFKEALLIEIMRGCIHRCTFCSVGNAFGPFRVREISEFKATLHRIPSAVKRIGLIGAAIDCHPGIEDILDYIRERDMSISFSSMRFEGISPKILEIMCAQGNRTLTLAPECGSDRLRRSLKKFIGNEVILKTAEACFSAGISNLRLYFMVGLPGERDEDITAFVQLLRQIREISQKKARKVCRISASINQFIPKAGTPLTTSPFEDMELVSEKMRRIRHELPSDLKLTFESPRWAAIQTLLAQGDRRLSAVLEHAEDLTSFTDWKTMLVECGINLRHLLGEKDTKRILPWSHIKGMKIIE